MNCFDVVFQGPSFLSYIVALVALEHLNRICMMFLHVPQQISSCKTGIGTQSTLHVFDFVMPYLYVVFQRLSFLCYMGALRALICTNWFLLFYSYRFWHNWHLRDPTVITNALQRIVLRPQRRPILECPLVDPILPHVQALLVNGLMMLK